MHNVILVQVNHGLKAHNHECLIVEKISKFEARHGFNSAIFYLNGIFKDVRQVQFDKLFVSFVNSTHQLDD
jgi:hypothetical protein